MRRKALLGGLLAVLALAAVYLTAANVLLGSDAIRARINARRDRLEITYATAWTPFPGILRIRDLRVRGNSRKVQWEARADEAWASIDLPLLAGRVFRVASLRGRGVEFRLRRRAESAAQAAAQDGLVPPIEGLAHTAPPPATRPGRRASWSVDFAAMDLRELREIWIEGARWRGDADARGGFRIRLGRDTLVRRSRLELRTGTLETGGVAAARGLAGTLRAEIQRFAHRGKRGWAVMAHTSGEAAVRGVLLDLRYLEPYLSQAPWLALRGGAGGFDARARLVRGRLAPGSRVELEERELAARFFDYEAAGHGTLTWSVDARDGDTDSATTAPPGPAVAADDATPRGRLHAALDGFAVRRLAESTPHLRGDGLTVDAITTDLDIDGDLRDLAVTLDMPEAEIPRLDFYNAYLPRDVGLALLAGSGRMRARFTTAGEGGAGVIAVHGDDVRARFEDVELAGQLELDARVATADVRRRDFDVSGTTLRLREVAVRDPRAPADAGDAAPPWHATVRLERGRLAPGSAVFLDAELAAEARDSRPLLALFAAKRPLPKWGRSLLEVENVRATGRLQAGEGLLLVDPLAVRGENLELQARLRAVPGTRRGTLLASWRDLALGVELRGVERELHLLKARSWFAAQPAP